MHVHTARADMLRRLGRRRDAATAYVCELALIEQLAERRFLQRRLASLGFIHAIKLLFSASFADETRTLADKLLNAPQRSEVKPRNRRLDSIEQQIFQVEGAHHARRQSIGREISKVGISADAIYSNDSQNARTRAR